MTYGHRNLARPRQRGESRLDELANRFVLALGRIAEDEIDSDVRTVDLHLSYRLGRAEVATGVRVDQRTQAGLDVGLGDGHRRMIRSGFEQRNSVTKNEAARYSERGRFARMDDSPFAARSEEHTSELQSHHDLVCRLLLE